MGNNDYWIDFWVDYTSDLEELDEQTQVLRTYDKKPISEELWNFTLSKIDEIFKIEIGDEILDLCSGNGLLAKHCLSKGASVVAVDISNELLKKISDIEGIEPINSDIRLLDFKKNSFNKIIFYAGIQYLNSREAIIMLQNIYKWLKPDGILLIGDIPDVRSRWEFFDTIERQKVFFDNILSEKAIIGTWFEREWFDSLSNYIGFSKGEFMPQDEKLIYSSFRFDYLYKK